MSNSSQRQRENFALPTEREIQAIQEERKARDQERARNDALRAEDARKHLQVFGMCMNLLTSDRADRTNLSQISKLTREFAEEYVSQELAALREGRQEDVGPSSPNGEAFRDSDFVQEDDGA